MSKFPSMRNRGGQPGNKNALKHGFYATRLLPSDAEDLEKVEPVDMADEIELIRIQIRRLLNEAAEQPANLTQRLEMLKIICIAARSLNHLIRTQYIIYPDSGLRGELRRMGEAVRKELEGETDDPDDPDNFHFTPPDEGFGIEEW